MTWADFASNHTTLSAIFGFVLLGLVFYTCSIISHAIVARYNLASAANRTTQEQYLVELMGPVLEESRTLSLADPVHRRALAGEIARKIVVG